jgi:hypothetical protein
MHRSSFLLPALLAFLVIAPSAALGAANLGSTAAVTPAGPAEPLPDFLEPQKPIRSTSCSARTKCYAAPFNFVSCTGEWECYASNGCYVYCDGFQYDCNPFFLCP